MTSLPIVCQFFKLSQQNYVFFILVFLFFTFNKSSKAVKATQYAYGKNANAERNAQK